MGKRTDEIFGSILRSHDVYPEAINETTGKVREALAHKDDGLYLSRYDLTVLTLYLDSLKDTTETLEEEIEKAVGAAADASDGENQVLMDNLEWTREELTAAKVSLQILAELNGQLFQLCEEPEKLTIMAQRQLSNWRRRFAPAVQVSKMVPEQWELVAGTYVLDTFKTEQEAKNALEILLSGLSLY